jgi:hypothetical protein
VSVAGLGQRERQIVLDVQTSEGVVLLARDSQIILVVNQQEFRRRIVMDNGPTQTTKLVMSVPKGDVVVFLIVMVNLIVKRYLDPAQRLSVLRGEAFFHPVRIVC